LERTQTRQGKLFDARWGGVLRHIEKYQVKFVAVTIRVYSSIIICEHQVTKIITSIYGQNGITHEM